MYLISFIAKQKTIFPLNENFTDVCIVQETVDKAEKFTAVFEQAQEWMRKHKLLGQSGSRRNKQKFVVVCDG